MCFNTRLLMTPQLSCLVKRSIKNSVGHHKQNVKTKKNIQPMLGNDFKIFAQVLLSCAH